MGYFTSYHEFLLFWKEQNLLLLIHLAQTLRGFWSDSRLAVEWMLDLPEGIDFKIVSFLLLFGVLLEKQAVFFPKEIAETGVNFRVFDLIPSFFNDQIAELLHRLETLLRDREEFQFHDFVVLRRKDIQVESDAHFELLAHSLNFHLIRPLSHAARDLLLISFLNTQSYNLSNLS